MAYGRDMAMQGLRKAGSAIRQLDEAYADRVNRDMGGEHANPLGVLLGGTPIGAGEITSRAERIQDMGRAPTDRETLLMNLGEGAMIGAVNATNLGYRYGLPAAGITLAGVALQDVAEEMTAQQSLGTLPVS